MAMTAMLNGLARVRFASAPRRAAVDGLRGGVVGGAVLLPTSASRSGLAHRTARLSEDTSLPLHPGRHSRSRCCTTGSFPWTREALSLQMRSDRGVACMMRWTLLNLSLGTPEAFFLFGSPQRHRSLGCRIMRSHRDAGGSIPFCGAKEMANARVHHRCRDGAWSGRCMGGSGAARRLRC
jgi:hypothetical protein